MELLKGGESSRSLVSLFPSIHSFPPRVRSFKPEPFGIRIMWGLSIVFLLLLTSCRRDYSLAFSLSIGVLSLLLMSLLWVLKHPRMIGVCLCRYALGNNSSESSFGTSEPSWTGGQCTLAVASRGIVTLEWTFLEVVMPEFRGLLIGCFGLVPSWIRGETKAFVPSIRL